ncbi:MAG: hypothetical protein J5736_01885, partial [Bacilli bacterium]|nr:hypothetical protein [Bacilli bacterium]
MAKNEKRIVFSFQLVGIIAFGVGFLALLIGDIIGRVNVAALGAPFDAIQAFGALFGTIGKIFAGEAVSNVRLLALFGLLALLFICAFLFIKVSLEKVKGRLSIGLLFVSALFLLIAATVLKVGLGSHPNGLWLVLSIFAGFGFFVAVLCFGFRALFAAGAKEIQESFSDDGDSKQTIRDIIREEINNQNKGDAEELRAIIRAELEDFKKNAAPTNIYVNMSGDVGKDEEPSEEKEALPVEEETPVEEVPVEEEKPVEEEASVEEQAQPEPTEEAVPEETAEEAPKEEESVPEEQPIEEQAEEESVSEEQPAEEQPIEEQSVEESVEEEPKEEQPEKEPQPEEQIPEEEAPAAEEPVPEEQPAQEEAPVEEVVQEEAPVAEESEPALEEETQPEQVEEGQSGSSIPNTGKSRLSFEDKLADMDPELRAKYDELCNY